MKVPMKWLNEYVKVNIPIEKYANRMIMSGSEVEGYTVLGENMIRVVVGRIIKLERHPNADRLQICQVDVGEETVQIVTGATNVFEGALVPVAKNGASLPNGLAIKVGELRGIPSVGMLCSGHELCIEESDYPGAEVDGILILEKDLQPGMDMRTVLGLEDTIVEFKTLANRPDCMSIQGIARETATTLNEGITFPTDKVLESGKSINDVVQISIKDKGLCLRYSARLVTGIQVDPSPKWMQDYLKHAGMRPINNVVDITNYVMLEMGQPLHAFDMRFIKQNKIIVRRALKNEVLLTLDEKERQLSTDMLVIADGEGPVALAGIMGGAHSGILPDTDTVLLESAVFLPGNIRVTSRTLGMRSESSARFEKGVDIENTISALNRAAALLAQYACGQCAKGVIDIYPNPIPQRVLTVSPEKINALVGLDIAVSDMVNILNKLFIPTKLEKGQLCCQIPSYRKDIEGTADIAEEILRIYGYDKLKSTLHPSTQTGVRTIYQNKVWKAREMMMGMGFSGIVTYSFISPREWDLLKLSPEDSRRQSIRLLNPLGEEMSTMRTTLIPGLLKVAATNINRKIQEMALFETNNVYIADKLPLTQLPKEEMHLSMVQWGKDYNLFTLKGVIETFLQGFGLENCKYEAAGSDFFHPGRKAVIKVGETILGEFGEILPDVAEVYGLTQRTYVGEINLHILFGLNNPLKTYQALPKYPPVERDIAMTVNRQISAETLRLALLKYGRPLLQQALIFDVYEGAQVEQGKKSMAFALNFRGEDRTLTDGEVNEAFDRIVKGLAEECGAQIRK